MESSNEQLLLRYISKCLCIEWTKETEQLIDYSKRYITCSGRPTATSRDRYKNISSILNIKILIPKKGFNYRPFPSYILEIALLCYLANVEYGYIAICFPKQKNQKIKKFISPLTLNKELSRKPYTLELTPKLENMNPITIDYEINETWINYPQHDAPVCVWKIKISKFNLQDVIDNLDNWWKDYLDKSPHLTKTESFSLFNTLETNPNPFIYKPKKD